MSRKIFISFFVTQMALVLASCYSLDCFFLKEENHNYNITGVNNVSIQQRDNSEPYVRWKEYDGKPLRFDDFQITIAFDHEFIALRETRSNSGGLLFACEPDENYYIQNPVSSITAYALNHYNNSFPEDSDVSKLFSLLSRSAAPTLAEIDLESLNSWIIDVLNFAVNDYPEEDGEQSFRFVIEFKDGTTLEATTDPIFITR